MKRRIPTAFILDSKSPATRGSIAGPQLNSDVRVHTDRWGIPRIQAADEHDLFSAQGWVHASQRLWQMEALRHLTAGRLAEIAGRGMLELDHFARIAGFPSICRRAAEGLSETSKVKIDSYLNGVNSFIEAHRGKLPLEFRSAGVEPEPWTRVDAMANLVVNSWYLQTNYLEEVLAVRARRKLSRAQWDAILPGMNAFDGEPIPEDRYFEKLRDCEIGAFHPATYAFYKEFPVICGASNNWAVADGPGGRPLIANDPHLGVQLPQIWFACGLSCPGTDLLGVGMPGFPGIVIGRTPEVSWAFTNVMTDIVDLYVLPIDPVKMTCTINGKKHALSVREEEFSLAGGQKEIRKIITSPHGPLMTEVNSRTDAAVALKWYGTLADEVVEDKTAEGILEFASVRNLKDLRTCAEKLSTVGQNIVAGDIHGNIMWQATGSVPRRQGYSGRLPADGSTNHDWKGFVPFDSMPRSENPDNRRLITANHRTVEADSPVMPTRAWAQPWRFWRIRDVLDSMNSYTTANFAVLQNDTVSLRPGHVLPVLLDMEFSDSRARELAEILADWDGDCHSESRACLIFNLLPGQICEILLRHIMGEELDLYYTLLPFFTGIMESIAADPRVIELFPAEDGSTPGLPGLVEEALLRIHRELTRTMGSNTRKWEWGRWHTLHFRHAGSKPGITSWMLNRGPWPAGGDWTTVNVCGFSLITDPGEATTIPSMRFISSLADKDENIICLPLGQCGRPGNRHYDDFAPLYRRGDYVPFPMDPGKTGKGGRMLILKGN